MYIFYDSARPTEFLAPHYNTQRELLGVKVIYTREDIEKLAGRGNLSATMSKRLLALREGNSLRLHYLHSCGDMMIKRLTAEEINLIETHQRVLQEQQQIRQAIRDATPALSQRLSELQAEERKLKKQGIKMGIKL